MTKSKRTKSIKVRVSEEELEQLRVNSTRSELARWMREHCLANDLKPKKSKVVSEVSPDLLRALSGIGNNLNQIARRVNSGEWGALDKVQVLTALAAVERSLRSLRDDS